jgi:hypothetical protein
VDGENASEAQNGKHSLLWDEFIDPIQLDGIAWSVETFRSTVQCSELELGKAGHFLGSEI